MHPLGRRSCRLLGSRWCITGHYYYREVVVWYFSPRAIRHKAFRRLPLAASACLSGASAPAARGLARRMLTAPRMPATAIFSLTPTPSGRMMRFQLDRCRAGCSTVQVREGSPMLVEILAKVLDFIPQWRKD